MKNVLFFLTLSAALQICSLSASAQCTAPCVSPEEWKSGTGFDYRLSKALTRGDKLVWPQVKLGITAISVSRTPFMTQETSPWLSDDFFQPGVQIKTKLLLHEYPDPSDGKLFFGSIRVTRWTSGGSGWWQAPKGGFTVWLIYEKPL